MAVKVLIVDDQPAFRRVARRVIEMTDGFEVVGEAASGEDSVEAVRAWGPDVVLMDVRLPGIDGLEACRRICGLGQPGRAPVILLVSTETPADAAEWPSACGAPAYLPKAEFDSERLVSAWARGTGGA